MIKKRKNKINCIASIIIIFSFVILSFNFAAGADNSNLFQDVFNGAKNIALGVIGAKSPIFLRAYFLDPFWAYFLVGFFAGFWMWAVNYLVRISNLKLAKVGWNIIKGDAIRDLRNSIITRSWLDVIAGRLWKVVVFGMFYAVIMQIPLLNRIMQIITFEMIMPTGIWNRLIRSFIIAFYVGFLPSIWEQYRQYKIRMDYWKVRLAIKSGFKTMAEAAKGV